MVKRTKSFSFPKVFRPVGFVNPPAKQKTWAATPPQTRSTGLNCNKPDIFIAFTQVN
jgi:hypothetical protein